MRLHAFDMTILKNHSIHLTGGSATWGATATDCAEGPATGSSRLGEREKASVLHHR